MLLTWLKNLFGRPESRRDLLEIFSPLDIDQIHRDLKIVESARKDGIQNKPNSNSIEESTTERKIRSLCEKKRDIYIEALGREKDSYLERRQEILGSWKVSTIENEESALVDDVIANVRQDIGLIENNATELRQLGQELINYRSDHELLYRLPVCHDIWSAVLILLFWFVAELIVTTVLLQESGGLLMVFVISTVYCFLNCLFPFIVGPIFRSVNYKFKYFFKTITGWVLSLLLIIVGAALNLLMGHYRSAALDLASRDYSRSDIESLQFLVDQVNNTGVRAWADFSANYFGINDTLSWLLAVAGFVAFMLSWREGYVRDDVYPKYGALSQRFQMHLKDIDELNIEVLVRLKERREQGVRMIQDRKRKLKDELGKIPEQQHQLKRLEDKFEGALRRLNDDHVELLKVYRQENRNVRNDSEPEYFRNIRPLPEYNLLREELDPGPSEDLSQQVFEKLSDFSKRLSKEFDTLMASVKPSSKILNFDPLEIYARTD